MNGIHILECECVQNDKGIQCLMVGGHLNYCPNIWSMKRFKFTRIEQNFQPWNFNSKQLKFIRTKKWNSWLKEGAIFGVTNPTFIKRGGEQSIDSSIGV